MTIELDELVHVAAGEVTLEGNLVVPADPLGIVVFAHGSGSSRHSPRNRFVAESLQKRGLATLLIDLLTSEEEEVDRVTAHLRFDIALLADRLAGATSWLCNNPTTSEFRIGYFGASTGAAAALIAAARLEVSIGAVVSRGGRPDLALDSLADVAAPTLLIVGGRDHAVIPLNEKAYDALGGEKKLEIVTGATHLFEEEGALEQVSELAGAWFARHLSTSNPCSSSGSSSRPSSRTGHDPAYDASNVR